MLSQQHTQLLCIAFWYIPTHDTHFYWSVVQCLAKFKECITKKGMTHKLVPLDCHHCSIAKRAIQMFKNHFVSILSGVDNRFPLSLQCHLVQPAELTINLLQQSNIAPKVSAYAHVHEQHKYMKCPFAPLGCAVVAHVKPKN